MNNVILFYNPELETPRRKGGRGFDRIRLMPGRNKLTEDKFNTLSSHPDYKKYEEMGAIKVLSQNIPDSESADFSKLKQDNAIALVQSELDPNNLKKWQSVEATGKKRDGVLNAIALQLKAVEEGKL